MNSIIRQYEDTLRKPEGSLPVVHPGDTVRVKINIYEGVANVAGLKKIHRIAAKGKAGSKEKAERIQTYEGTVICVMDSGAKQRITVRKLASGVGVEKTFYIHNSKIAGIEVVRRAKVRRAKLYFLRDRVGKATRLREKREARPQD
jgi:large subunit ribosomal protein L19